MDENMRRLRASLGMANDGPQFKVKDDSPEPEEEDNISTFDKRYAAADSNWEKLENERLEKIAREKRKAAAMKARDTAARHAKLEGKGLGEADEDEAKDTRTWLMEHNKRQKKIKKAREFAAELAEREAKMQAEYTAKDLAGVKVAHEADQFDEAGGEKILTLKDAEIGEDSGEDELENQELNAKAKLEEKLESKKKRPDYDPTAFEEKKAVLSKYDEEIEGKQKKRFTLDGKGNTAEVKRKALDAAKDDKKKGIKIDMDIFEDITPVSDYADPSTVKVKKPKKKKEKKTRQKVADEDDIIPLAEQAPAPHTENNAMDVDGGEGNAAPVNRKRTFEYEDDEDLQFQLAEQRRQALKKRKKMDGAEYARQLREQMQVDQAEPEEEEGGMVINETKDFVEALKAPHERDDFIQPAARNIRQAQPSGSPPVEADEDEDEDGDATMAEQSYGEIANEDELAALKSGANAQGGKPFDEEGLVGSSGVAATLSLLRERGHWDDSKSAEEQKKTRDRNHFLAEKDRLIAEFDAKTKREREEERRSGRYDKMTHKERENLARQQNEAREAFLGKVQNQLFERSYKPNVKLEYHDSEGREMNEKEAFKHLSHMFHGKGSGNGKTDYNNKKKASAQRIAQKGVLSVGENEGLAGVQAREGKNKKTPGIRLM